jgi:hypothetical protein
MVDIQAVRNAVIESWSNGQTEGQINRLKALKRAMYGRASVASLCARMRPLREVEYHRCEPEPVYMYRDTETARQPLLPPAVLLSLRAKQAYGSRCP